MTVITAFSSGWRTEDLYSQELSSSGQLVFAVQQHRSKCTVWVVGCTYEGLGAQSSPYLPDELSRTIYRKASMSFPAETALLEFQEKQ